MEIVFVVGPSRFRARFHRDSCRGECEVVDLYFRAEPIAATAVVACVISGPPLFPETGESEASSDESTIAR
jgi:hypothetical protein